MPRASKRFLDDKVWKEINETFPEVLSSFEPRGLKKFLSEFLTKEERTMVAKRLTIYLMIFGSYSESEIKETLKVSHETVRVAKESLASKSDQFKNALVLRLKKLGEKESTNRLIKMLDLALSSKSNIKARAKLTSGDY
ncbi:MAG: hypothetical protein A2Y57_01005 [Candidatus Woykebacteria bacterium RBG_13_40_7b]|uniref:Uncharacterized protein n=1 Tax=Candidatus Woykebacteria bacterium RBG_13_40_7b TaxID=1802594 RepID=A0A1G1WB69_9BACT|nr:MAG: hypothetical protein A2Y57_01005 [Candidatus Woykebacteria bacterium RBG_13_40_7b]